MEEKWITTVNGQEHIIVFEKVFPIKQSKLYIDNKNIDIPESAFVKMLGIDYPFNIDGRKYRFLSTEGSYSDLVENGVLKKSKKRYIPFKVLLCMVYLGIFALILGLLLYWEYPKIGLILCIISAVATKGVKLLSLRYGFRIWSWLQK